MKKVFIILLMLTYGLSSSGMTINVHFCCGKLDDISFSSPHGQRCAMGKHDEKSSCCNDKQITAKLETDQQATAKWVQTQADLIVAPAYTHSLTPTFLVPVNLLARGTPVPIPNVPILIKNCVFRI